jgi:hypothetical protein
VKTTTTSITLEDADLFTVRCHLELLIPVNSQLPDTTFIFKGNTLEDMYLKSEDFTSDEQLNWSTKTLNINQGTSIMDASIILKNAQIGNLNVNGSSVRLNCYECQIGNADINIIAGLAYI